MTAEAKIKSLAGASALLQPYFGSGQTSRVFDRRLIPGELANGSCVSFRRISTRSFYRQTQAGRGDMTAPLFEFTVRDFSALNCRAARDAVIQWLGTVSFAENNQFASPATTPPHFPCFVENERSDMDYDIQAAKGPVYVEQIDVRLYNLET